MSSQPSPKPEEIFVSGRYRIVRWLGSGAIGTVYLTQDVIENRLVTLKLLKKDQQKLETLNQLQQEFQAVSALRHPLIASAYNFGYTEDLIPYYTREYISGTPLAGGPPPLEGPNSPKFWLSPILDLLEALEYLHNHGILHLDIHSGNLIVPVDKAKGSVLIDLSQALIIKKQPFSTSYSTKNILCPPEIQRGDEVSNKTDIYAAARLLYFRLTGNNDGDAYLPQEIPDWGIQKTLELERVLTKALQIDPKNRFHSAKEFRNVLSDIVGIDVIHVKQGEPSEFSIGREIELQDVKNALNLAENSKAKTICISGPDGIGKSRLLKEAKTHAQFRGFEVIEAKFSNEEKNLHKIIQSQNKRTFNKIEWIKSLSFTHGGSTEERCQLSAESLYLQPGPPLALLLDDIEFADRESLILIRAIIEHSSKAPPRGVAIFITYQAEGKEFINSPNKESIKEKITSWNQKFISYIQLKGLDSTHSESLLNSLLRPTQISKENLSTIIRLGKGSPLLIRRITRYIKGKFEGENIINEKIVIPQNVIGTTLLPEWVESIFGGPKKELVRKILKTLASISRPAHPNEILQVITASKNEIIKILKTLNDLELLERHIDENRHRYYFRSPETEATYASEITAIEDKHLHRTLAAYLQDLPRKSLTDKRNTILHYIKSGQLDKARKDALVVSKEFKKRGSLDLAIQLLIHILEFERDISWRLQFIEEISTLYELSGDHQEGVHLLSPVYEGIIGKLKDSERIRITRRLAIHFHRGGFAEKALELFQEIQSIAHPQTDGVELALVESELSELYLLQGEFETARSSCERGLDLLKKIDSTETQSKKFIECLLRGNLGHLELRLMNLKRAKEELQLAVTLSNQQSTTSIQALYLNNLGIVYNQLNSFKLARDCFHKAEKLLNRSGKHRGIIQIALNLATIEAKTGNTSESLSQLDRASHLLSLYPGKRLSFQVQLTQGIVFFYNGDLSQSEPSLKLAIEKAKELNDVQSDLQLSLYLVDTHLLSGSYGKAYKEIQRIVRTAKSKCFNIIERFSLGRLYLLESLFGRDKAAQKIHAELDAIPRSSITILELWNDLAVATGEWIEGKKDSSQERFLLTAKSFKKIGIPLGFRLAKLGVKASGPPSLSQEDSFSFLAVDDSSSAKLRTPILSVLEPLYRAKVTLNFNDFEGTDLALKKSTGSIVGIPMLEADWCVEYFRAKLSERQGNRDNALRELHRSLHSRQRLIKSVPAKFRKGFLNHPRFRELDRLSIRLEKPGPTPLFDRKSALFKDIIGKSPAIQNILDTVLQLRNQDLSILIRGESGTGKELIARALHATSRRQDGLFFALNCSSLPTELFEAELFGYESGAFTSADESRSGLLEHLRGGTLFLDHIERLPLECQTKLLRVIDQRAGRRIGGTEWNPIDVRFLSSSVENLEDLIAENRFSQDLYHRIAVIDLHLPPLRERIEDLPELIQHIIKKHKDVNSPFVPRFDEQAIQALRQFDWPGNVRQLESIILRSLIECQKGGDTIDENIIKKILPKKLKAKIFDPTIFRGRDLQELTQTLQQEYLHALYDELDGDLAKMSEHLGIQLAALYKWFKKVGINIKALRKK